MLYFEVIDMSMFKYITGGKPPPCKVLKTPTEKLERQHKYEVTVRKRKFVASWTHGRPWLQLRTNDSEQYLICTVCEQAGSVDANIFIRNSFAKGYIAT